MKLPKLLIFPLVLLLSTTSNLALSSEEGEIQEVSILEFGLLMKMIVHGGTLDESNRCLDEYEKVTNKGEYIVLGLNYEGPGLGARGTYTFDIGYHEPVGTSGESKPVKTGRLIVKRSFFTGRPGRWVDRCQSE